MAVCATAWTSEQGQVCTLHVSPDNIGVQQLSMIDDFSLCVHIETYTCLRPTPNAVVMRVNVDYMAMATLVSGRMP